MKPETETTTEQFFTAFSSAKTLAEAVALYHAHKGKVEKLDYSGSHHRIGREANRLCCSLLYRLSSLTALDSFAQRCEFLAAAEEIAAPWQVLSIDHECARDIFDEDGEMLETVSASPEEPGAYERLIISGADNGVQWDNEVPETLAHILNFNYECREGSTFWYTSKLEE